MRKIAFEKFVLPNGLTVIFHEDRSSPLVAVNIWYHVGSKDEEPGRTGFAHLFEHLMFMGSKNAPYPSFDSIMESWGGHNNGTTSNDGRTTTRSVRRTCSRPACGSRPIAWPRWPT